MNRRKWLIVGGVVLIWPILALGAARLLIVSKPIERADAIVILSGSATFSERVEVAASLYKDGRAAKIILTNDNQLAGWSNEVQRNPFFYERANWSLIASGVNASDIEILKQPVAGTYDEAVLVRTFATDHKLNSLLFVTSAYHSRRALWILNHEFRQTRIQIGLVTAATGQQTPNPSFWWCHRRGWTMVPGEYLKLVYYWIAYS